MTEPFSVVIPAFNARATLTRAMESVIGQAHVPFELIVVDDGSTDGGVEEVRAQSRVTVVRQDRAGAGPARNLGLKAASHAWVAFLDADDFWLPGHLAELDRVRAAFPGAALIGTRPVETDRAGRYRLRGQAHPRVERIDYLQRVARERPFAPSSCAVRREAALAAGGFRPYPLGEDTELFVRLSLAHPVAVSTRVTSVLVRGAGSATERATHRWKGAELRSPSDLAPAVAAALAATPPPPGLDAFVDRYVGWCLRASVQIGDVETIRRLPRLYRRTPPRGDRMLLALGRLPAPVAVRLRRPAALLSRISDAASRSW